MFATSFIFEIQNYSLDKRVILNRTAYDWHNNILYILYLDKSIKIPSVNYIKAHLLRFTGYGVLTVESIAYLSNNFIVTNFGNNYLNVAKIITNVGDCYLVFGIDIELGGILLL